MDEACWDIFHHDVFNFTECENNELCNDYDTCWLANGGERLCTEELSDC